MTHTLKYFCCVVFLGYDTECGKGVPSNNCHVGYVVTAPGLSAHKSTHFFR